MLAVGFEPHIFGVGGSSSTNCAKAIASLDLFRWTNFSVPQSTNWKVKQGNFSFLFVFYWTDLDLIWWPRARGYFWLHRKNYRVVIELYFPRDSIIEELDRAGAWSLRPRLSIWLPIRYVMSLVKQRSNHIIIFCY